MYAAYLQAADAVWEAQFLVRRVFDRYEAFQGQLEAAQASDNPEVAVSGLQEELRVLKERADVRTDSADGYISTLNARFFEVELIAPEHLRAAAKVVKKAAQTNATVTVQGGEIERRQADDELNQAIRGFVLFARIDTDSPNAWVLPKYALWVARKRADSSLKKHRPEELHSPS